MRAQSMIAPHSIENIMSGFIWQAISSVRQPPGVLAFGVHAQFEHAVFAVPARMAHIASGMFATGPAIPAPPPARAPPAGAPAPPPGAPAPPMPAVGNPPPVPAPPSSPSSLQPAAASV